MHAERRALPICSCQTPISGKHLTVTIDFKSDRILAIVAHPDDAELLCAGTLARAKADGATIAICVLCQGDKGQPSKPIANLAKKRRVEMIESGKLLRAEIFFGEIPDGTLADTTASRLALVEIFRRFKPTLVLVHSPNDYHADHRAASALAEAASWFCASRGQKTKAVAMDTPPALWFMDTVNMSGFEPSIYIDVTAFLPLKQRMLQCHMTQLARGDDGDFSPLSELMRLQALSRGAQSGVVAAEAFRPHSAFKRTRAL
jgi:LmbE family N-acetylglucosaminyl deacetylase